MFITANRNEVMPFVEVTSSEVATFTTTNVQVTCFFNIAVDDIVGR